MPPHFFTLELLSQILPHYIFSLTNHLFYAILSTVMENPSLNDVLNSLAKLCGIVQQAIKQIEDLQDIVSRLANQVEFQQEALNKLKILPFNIKIPLPTVFVIKKPDSLPLSKAKEQIQPAIPQDAPQTKNAIFWLPGIADCNSIGGKN